MPIADDRGGVAVAGVACRDDRLLIVRRAALVVAPGQYCFPGGMLETDETPRQALKREFREELGIAVTPLRRLWRSVTPWQVQVDWWLVGLSPDQPLRLNTQEVDQARWVNLDEMRSCQTLLESNRQWLKALDEGAFSLA